MINIVMKSLASFCRIPDTLRSEIPRPEHCLLILFISCPRMAPMNSETFYIGIRFVCVCVFFLKKANQQLQNVRTPTELLVQISISKNWGSQTKSDKFLLITVRLTCVPIWAPCWAPESETVWKWDQEICVSNSIPRHLMLDNQWSRKLDHLMNLKKSFLRALKSRKQF